MFKKTMAMALAGLMLTSMAGTTALTAKAENRLRKEAGNSINIRPLGMCYRHCPCKCLIPQYTL